MPFTVGSNTKGNVPAGNFPAVLEAVTITNIVSAFSPQGKDMREWHFLANVNGDMQPISGLTSMSTGPASNAYRWLAALLRRELKAGESIEDPIGQNCIVVVALNQKGYPAVKDVLPAASVEQTTLPDGTQVPR